VELGSTLKKPGERYRAVEAVRFEGTTQKAGEEMEAEEEVEGEELKNFDKITDLFVDISSWEIVVRVLEKSYREFNNKAGKLTKIFSMQLVDRTGTKIEGVMFGDSAQSYYEMIRANGVYRMSRGQIREEGYNLNRGDKFSKYNIIFTRNSNFVPLRDIPLIPYAVDASLTFPDLLREATLDRQFDIVALLLNIGEERTFEKDGRSIFKKTLLIGDPLLLRSIEVVIWNKDMLIRPDWLGRTVQLRNFKLNNYRDTLSLNSLFKSDIQPIKNHRFVAEEGKHSEGDFRSISEGSGPAQAAKEKLTKTIKELEQEVGYAGASEVTYSDLEVWLTHASFKGKWHYEACNNPKCKKGTEPFTVCVSCGTQNGQTNRKFILPIEISDITGSLWTTAFDEFAQEIFKDLPMEALSRMGEPELKEEAEKRLYQQFKVRLSTRKDQEGNVKHAIVGKVLELSVERASISNVERIKRMLYE
jgi:replication factor A1